MMYSVMIHNNTKSNVWYPMFHTQRYCSHTLIKLLKLTINIDVNIRFQIITNMRIYLLKRVCTMSPCFDLGDCEGSFVHLDCGRGQEVGCGQVLETPSCAMH